jgi:hypothetical protein
MAPLSGRNSIVRPITGVAVTIPRWQWRILAPDLSWLADRLSAHAWSAVRPTTEIHLVCMHSAHHAWLHGDELVLRWRKEVGPHGFELWDTILRRAAPFPPASLARLYSAWSLPEPESRAEALSVADLLRGPIAATPSVRPVTVHRQGRTADLEGMACRFEEVATEAVSSPLFESFSIEHEDPSLMARWLRDVGLRRSLNSGFLDGLKRGLEPQSHARRSKLWAKRSNANSW